MVNWLRHEYAIRSTNQHAPSRLRALFKDDRKHYHLLRLKMPYWELLGELVLKLVQAERYLGQGMIAITRPFQLETLENYRS
jgi:hypothetical protein